MEKGIKKYLIGDGMQPLLSCNVCSSFACDPVICGAWVLGFCIFGLCSGDVQFCIFVSFQCLSAVHVPVFCFCCFGVGNKKL